MDTARRLPLKCPGSSIMIIRDSVKNRLLASLSLDEFAVIGPLLAPVALPVKRVLQTRASELSISTFQKAVWLLWSSTVIANIESK